MQTNEYQVGLISKHQELFGKKIENPTWDGTFETEL
jgi:hypothetical protein